MPVIRVSFKETPDDLELYRKIKEASKYTGDSGWIKQVAAEKLGETKMELAKETQKSNVTDIIF